MKNKVFGEKIPAEVIAAFLDGNATAAESEMILNSLACDEELRELLSISQAVDFEVAEHPSQDLSDFPLTAMAAASQEGNMCCLECEKYILKQNNIEFDQAQLLENAIINGWQKEEGTALHNVGRHLEEYGFDVTMTFDCTIRDIENALAAGSNVIVAVDSGELTGNHNEEMMEDMLEGEKLDHLVVVLSVQKEDGTIIIFDPDSENTHDVHPIERFVDAWNDSRNYLAVVSSKS